MDAAVCALISVCPNREYRTVNDLEQSSQKATPPMSRSQSSETTQSTTAFLPKRDRRKIVEVVREKANKVVDEYTTVGELRELAREVVQSETIRIGIAAPYDAKMSVAAEALAEQVREEVTRSL